MAASSSRRPGPPVIACIGDIDVDWLMQVDRLPSHDDKLPARSLVRRPGGMAANVAFTVQRLGGESRLIGRVGNDDEGQELLAHLRNEGVDVGGVVVVDGERTFQCLVFIGPAGERALVRLPSALVVPSPTDIDDANLSGCDHVHLTCTDALVVARVADLSRRLGFSISIDIEEADLPRAPSGLRSLLDGIDLAFMNQRTRQAVEGGGVLKDFRGALVTTVGAGGARFEAPGFAIDSPGHQVDVRDTTGAGDAFAGAFLMSWLVERDDPQAGLARANRVAAYSTCEIGAQAGIRADAAMLAEADAPVASGGLT